LADELVYLFFKAERGAAGHVRPAGYASAGIGRPIPAGTPGPRRCLRRGS